MVNVMPSYLARVFYLGDNFHGSQAQPGLRTVQGELISAVSQWSGEFHSTNSIRLSGRTDRGVHSIGQLVMVTTNQQRFDLNAINKHLPSDICLWASTQVLEQFSPRYDVLMRHYRYVLTDASDLDVVSMRQGAQVLCGFHDFRYLSKRDGNRSTFTTLLNIALTPLNDILVIDVYGTSFLWKLVRKIVSVLALVGKHEISLTTLRDLVECRATLASGIRPAPPECLFLIEAIVPFKLQTHKYAMRRVRRYLSQRIGYLHRALASLSAIFGATGSQWPLS